MISYVVQAGDTIWRIAQQYGVTPEAIIRANDLPDPNLIFPGQVLMIPVAGVPPGPPAPRPTPPRPPGPPAPVPPVTVVPGFRVYIVQPGDTLAEIASRYGTTIEAIAAANNITNPDLIYAGQMILIPVTGPPPAPPTPPPAPPVPPPRPPVVPPTVPPVVPPGRRGNYATRLEGGILYMLYTNQRIYNPGEPVRIIFSKTNVSGAPISLQYGTGQQFDILIMSGGEEIWRWSHGKVFIMMITEVTLSPGESQVFREVWNQVDNQGRRVPQGRRYTITAWNTSTNVEVSLDIEISSS